MKQLLFISAGEAYPEGASAFLHSLKKHDNFHVRGLFFSPLDYQGNLSASYVPGSTAWVQTKEKERKAVIKNKERFVLDCEKSNIAFDIHDNDEPWSKQLFVKESRFADLVVVSGETFYSELDANAPNLFLHEALRETESPIVVIPEKYTPVEHIYFAYDGSRESLYALKQFTYLFPHMTKLPAEVLYAREEESEEAPDKDLLKTYAHLHYENIGFSKLHFKPADLFPAWVGDKQHALLVSGSFGRSSLSYLTRRSFAEKLIYEHKLPLFITHF
jgi:hypothetical protein